MSELVFIKKFADETKVDHTIINHIFLYLLPYWLYRFCLILKLQNPRFWVHTFLRGSLRPLTDLLTWNCSVSASSLVIWNTFVQLIDLSVNLQSRLLQLLHMHLVLDKQLGYKDLLFGLLLLERHITTSLQLKLRLGENLSDWFQVPEGAFKGLQNLNLSHKPDFLKFGIDGT